MVDLSFPKSLPDFQRLFPDDAACAKYLEDIRFREGFQCPHCQSTTIQTTRNARGPCSTRIVAYPTYLHRWGEASELRFIAGPSELRECIEHAFGLARVSEYGYREGVSEEEDEPCSR